MRPDEFAADAAIEATVDRSGIRLDRFLTEREDIASRSAARRLIDQGRVRVNGACPKKAGERLEAGDAVTYWLPPPEPDHVEAQAIPLAVVYEDEHLVVVDKPRGMVVHPSPGHASDTLLNALLHRYPSIKDVGPPSRPGIVHRLDKETTGLLVAALTPQAHDGLLRSMKAREVQRVYLALVHGNVRADHGIVDAPIGRHPAHRQKMAVVGEKGRPAFSRFRVLERFDGFTLVEVELVTGRTHQIRVHMAHLGHPVAADSRYGGRARQEALGLMGHALHAARLGFRHPITGEDHVFKSPLPGDFEAALRRLRSSLET